MKEVKEHYQNLIIGFGKGGKTLAAYLAKQNQEVAIVEQSERMYGGTCINVACIPSKSLITSAEKGVAYADAVKIKDELTSFLRKKNYDNLEGQETATVITGTASFLSHQQVRIILTASGKEVIVTAKRIFINTGSEPFIPDIPGLKASKRVFASASLMEQSQMPKKLIIVGGGFIGLEFADMYAKFGSDVTLLDHGRDFLPQEDRDIADEIYKILLEKKIRIVVGASVQAVEDRKEGVVVRYKTINDPAIEIEATAVLMATGRNPNTNGLDLAAAGIKTDGRGFVAVNDRLQTNVDGVWAIGDVNGGPQFTYISLDDFRIIRDQLFGGHHTSVTNRKLVASSVFITPPLAHIGLREREAKEKGYRIKVAKVAAATIPRARILNETRGILKSVIDAESNQILGCTLLCAEASEMINTIQVAMNARLDYRTVRDTIFTHPSMTEAFNDLFATI